jgi:hypothetical protein
LTGGPNYFPWYEMLGVPSINDGAPVDFSSAGECTGAACQDQISAGDYMLATVKVSGSVSTCR